MKKQSFQTFKVHGQSFVRPWLKMLAFQDGEKELFHIDEAMSWETVRNLKLMPPLVLVIRNLCVQSDAPEDVLTWLNEIQDRKSVV